MKETNVRLRGTKQICEEREMNFIWGSVIRIINQNNFVQMKQNFQVRSNCEEFKNNFIWIISVCFQLRISFEKREKFKLYSEEKWPVTKFPGKISLGK